MGFACDPCSIRKIKCHGGSPCEQCLATSLSCSYERKRKKSGPKGPRKRTKEAIEQAQRSSKRTRQSLNDNGLNTTTALMTQSSLAQTDRTSDTNGSPNSQGSDGVYDSSSTVPVQGNDRVPLSSLTHYMNIYHHYLYVVWPVVKHQELLARLSDTNNRIAYALATSICSATIAQLRLPTDDHGQSSHSIAYEAEKSRLMLDYPMHQTVDALLTCFFLHVYYSNTGKIAKSTLLLREAIAYAHILGLHQDLFYTDLDTETSQYHLRIAWILFITDR